MKSNVNNTNKMTYTLPIVLVCIYTFTRGGAALLLSNTIWTIVLFFFLLCSFFNLTQNSSVKCNNETALVVLMIGIILCWNNQDFAHGTWFTDYIIIVYMFFLLLAMKTDRWMETAFRMMLVMGVFHMIMTLLCFAFPSVFTNIVYPIVQPITIFDLKAMYNKGIIMGFNYSNSQDAIYLAMGIMTLICSFMFSNKKEKKYKNTYVILILLFMIALLLTGKRGPILWLFLAFVWTYYVYNCNKKLERWFKILSIILLIVGLIYIGSFFIPGLMNFINRFSEQIEAGDISSSRFELWEMGWNEFKNKPIFGHGWFWFKYNNSFGTIFNVHNCYIQWLCELGIIGSLPFFAFTVSTYIRNIKLIKMIRLGYLNVNSRQMRNLAFSLMYQTYFVVFCFAGTSFYEPETLLPWIFSCGMVTFYWHDLYINNCDK
ncbi:O-antigen ligase family protein [Ruminococcus sp.]|uniref:O-antigen ligase family protein n=1 Tax=Ruminococcus sp. TaxID=41978 RepID=UPI0025D2F93A|nr:O-antigen ligase family protein [Ruminococcus sp.]